MVEHWGYSLPVSRKLMAAISTFGVGAAFVFVPSTTNPAVAVGLFTVATGCSAASVSGSDLALADLFSEHIGLVFGIMNALTSLAGAAAPLIIGEITGSAGCAEHSNEKPSPRCDHAWSTVFHLTAGIYATGGVLFLVLSGFDPEYARLARRGGAVSSPSFRPMLEPGIKALREQAIYVDTEQLTGPEVSEARAQSEPLLRIQ